jgi:hypothetical protein
MTTDIFFVKGYEYSKKDRLKNSIPLESGLFHGMIYNK